MVAFVASRVAAPAFMGVDAAGPAPGAVAPGLYLVKDVSENHRWRLDQRLDVDNFFLRGCNAMHKALLPGAKTMFWYEEASDCWRTFRALLEPQVLFRRADRASTHHPLLQVCKEDAAGAVPVGIPDDSPLPRPPSSRRWSW